MEQHQKTSACPGKPGDLIAFHRSLHYDHFAVNAGDGYIIHKTSDRNPKDVTSGDASGFSVAQCLSSNSRMGVVKKEKFSDFKKPEDNVTVEDGWKGKTALSRDKILKRAEEKVGERGFNLFTNNCEHLARYCRYGEERSDQADNLVFGLEVGGAGAVAAGLIAGGICYFYNRNKKKERNPHY